MSPPRRHRVPDSIVLQPVWRRHPIVAAVTAILLGVVVYDRVWRATPTGEDDYEEYHDRTFRVDRVVDGDTIDIVAPDGDSPITRVRLWGVDAPESHGSQNGGMYYGQQASDYATCTLSGRSVHIVLSPDRTRGKYGRLLAYVYLQRDGPMFNEMLLETGHAYADLRFDHHYRKKFEAFEKHAAKVGAGLWASVTLEQMPQWRQDRRRR